MLQFVRCLELLKTSLKSWFQIFKMLLIFSTYTELLNILPKNHFPYFLTSKLLKNCLSKLHHFLISFQYNFTTEQSILDMTV